MFTNYSILSYQIKYVILKQLKNIYSYKNFWKGLINMKARLKQIGPWWYGQVYATWYCFITQSKWTGWQSVTNNCYTKLGAKIELKKWKDENNPDEFNL